MSKRACDYCGNPINTLRADARFCTTKCRVYAARNAQKAPVLPIEIIEKARFLRFSRTKEPYAVSGRRGSSINPATWSTHSGARASEVGVGIGFVLNGDGIGVIDLDHCIDNGVVAPWAQEIIDANAGTFIEISISGTGIHIWGLLESRPGRLVRDGRNIEVYTTGRYMALGTPFQGSSAALLPLKLPTF